MNTDDLLRVIAKAIRESPPVRIGPNHFKVDAYAAWENLSIRFTIEKEDEPDDFWTIELFSSQS